MISKAVAMMFVSVLGPVFTVACTSAAVHEVEPAITPTVPSLLASSDEAGWAGLRSRPLAFERQPADEPCAISPHGVADAPPLTLGTGPLYPWMVGEGVIGIMDADRANGGYYVKTLWVAAPTFAGAALIRGANLSTLTPVRFVAGPNAEEELLFPSGDPGVHSPAIPRGWRAMSSQTFVDGPGCFAFQVDTVEASKQISFKVEFAEGN